MSSCVAFSPCSAGNPSGTDREPTAGIVVRPSHVHGQHRDLVVADNAKPRTVDPHDGDYVQNSGSWPRSATGGTNPETSRAGKPGNSKRFTASRKRFASSSATGPVPRMRWPNVES